MTLKSCCKAVDSFDLYHMKMLPAGTEPEFALGIIGDFYKECSCLHQGRNTVKLVTTSFWPRPLVVKRFGTPNVFQRIGALWKGDRGLRAYRNAEELQRRGFATPKPILYVDADGAGVYIATEVDTGAPLCQFIGQEDVEDALADSFAAFTYDLHNAGIVHRDYNNTNIRVRSGHGGWTFSLIDVDRMSIDKYGVRPSAGKRLKNLRLFSDAGSFYKKVLMRYVALDGDMSVKRFHKDLEAKMMHDKRYRRKKLILNKLKRIFSRV